MNEIVVLCAEEWSEGSHRITKRSLLIVRWMAASPFSFSLVHTRMEQQQQQQLGIMAKRETTLWQFRTSSRYLKLMVPVKEEEEQSAMPSGFKTMNKWVKNAKEWPPVRWIDGVK